MSQCGRGKAGGEGTLTWTHGLAAIGTPLGEQLEQLAAQVGWEVHGRHPPQLLTRSRAQRCQAASQLLCLQRHLFVKQHTRNHTPDGSASNRWIKQFGCMPSWASFRKPQ